MLRGFTHFIFASAVMLLAHSMSAQETTAAYHNLISTNAVSKPATELKSAPQAMVGTNTIVTGLLVDVAKPRQAWAMMNPTNAMQKQFPAAKPVAAQAPTTFNGNLAVHEADFSVVSFHFAHTSKPVVPAAKENPTQP